MAITLWIQKSYRLLGKTTTLHVHLAFWYLQFLSWHNFNVKLHCVRSSGLHKQTMTNFSFSFLALILRKFAFFNKSSVLKWSQWIWKNTNSLYNWWFFSHLCWVLPCLLFLFCNAFFSYVIRQTLDLGFWIQIVMISTLWSMEEEIKLESCGTHLKNLYFLGKEWWVWFHSAVTESGFNLINCCKCYLQV